MLDLQMSTRDVINQARGKCKEYLKSYRKVLETDKYSSAAMSKVLTEAVGDSEAFFKSGLGLTDPTVLAQWASEWSNYHLMLSEFMLSVPSKLITLDLLATCMQMTDNDELLMLFAKQCIRENSPKKLQALYDAGFKPVMDAHQVRDFLHAVPDVRSLDRDLFLPFLDAAIETHNQTKLVGFDPLMAMVGRYLGCKGGLGPTLQAFKQDVWPKISHVKIDASYGTSLSRVLKDNSPSPMDLFIQLAVSEYSTEKTVRLLKFVAKDCCETPAFLLTKAPSFGRNWSMHEQNPYNHAEVASHIPPEIMINEIYFNMINNNSMDEDFLKQTLPRLLESELSYSSLEGYQRLRERAEGMDVAQLMRDSVKVPEKAAIIHIMCKNDDAFDALFEGEFGKAPLYLFEDRLPGYLESSDRAPYLAGAYFSKLSESSLEQIEHEKAYLQAARGLGVEIAEQVCEFGENLVEHATSFDKARAYLENQAPMSQTAALAHCKALARNDLSPEKDPQKLLRMIDWKNESIIEDALGEDLGL